MQVSPTAPQRERTVLGLPQPVAEALGYALVAVLCAWLGITGLWGVFLLLPEYGSPWWTLVTAVPAAVLALMKRRAPLAGCIAAAALFAIDLVATGGLVPFIVLLDLLYALTVSLDAPRRRRVLVAVAAATGMMMLLALLATHDLRITVVIGLQIGALLGTTYWYGTAVAQSRELVELHRQQAEDATRLAELGRAAAVRGERERMARELHDVIAGHVAAVAIRSEAALAAADGVQESAAGASEAAGSDSSAPATPPGGAEESAERTALRAVRDSSLEAHGALRTMISVLRDGSGSIATPPGHERIAGMVEEARRSGVSVELEDGIRGRIPAPLSQTIGRVVQESLSNGARHASGSNIDVRLSDAGGVVLVEVASRGGVPLARPELRGSGMGLQMLEERVRALGGEFEAGPEHGDWVVRARIPAGAER